MSVPSTAARVSRHRDTFDSPSYLLRPPPRRRPFLPRNGFIRFSSKSFIELDRKVPAGERQLCRELPSGSYRATDPAFLLPRGASAFLLSVREFPIPRSRSPRRSPSSFSRDKDLRTRWTVEETLVPCCTGVALERGGMNDAIKIAREGRSGGQPFRPRGERRLLCKRSSTGTASAFQGLRRCTFSSSSSGRVARRGRRR